MYKLLAPLLALTLAPVSSAHAAATAAPPVAAPKILDWTIENGLRVLLLPRPQSPSVAVQLFYHAGSKDELDGKRGIAHLFEHMMFKGSRRVAPEALARFINQLGGENNAMTTDDLTAYETVVPPAALDFTLALEAERMRGLALDQNMLDSEREVVKEELRARVENSPISQGIQRIMGIAYTLHPYRVMPIGTKEMLDAVTVPDCRRFYDLYYQPNNATLVIVGAATEEDVRRIVAKHFGALPRGPEIVRQRVVEPQQTVARKETLELPMELGVILGAYHVPGATHADQYPLEVLQEILSGGESSRLYRRIVRGGLGVFAGGALFDHEEPSLFVTYAQLAPGGNPVKAQAAFDDELRRVVREKVSTAELRKAKNQLATRALAEREHSSGLASAIGEAALMKGDPTAPFSDLARLDKVSAEDVLAVAKKYLVPSNQTTLYLRPKARDVAAVDVPPPAPKAAKLVAPTLTNGLKPPANLPAPQLSLGEVIRETLPNGIELILVPRHELPIVQTMVVVPAGNSYAPLARMGVAELTAEMLRKGAGKRNATQIADLVEGAGAALASGVSDERTMLSCRSRVGDVPMCLELLADLAMRPRFPEAELKQARTELLATSVQDLRDNAEGLAQQHLANLYFGDDDPRGRPISEKTVTSIVRKDLVDFYAARYRPDGAYVVVMGDIDLARVKALLGRPLGLGTWTKKGALPVPVRALPAARPLRVRLIDKPDATQTALLIAGPGIAHGAADLFPIMYVNYILGGGDFSSRLMQVVRADGGKTYGVSSSFQLGRDQDLFYVSTSTRVAETAHTLKLVFGEIEKMRKGGPTAAELVEARGNLVGRQALGLETASQIGGKLLGAAMDGLPPDFVEKLPAALQAVTLEQTKQAAAAHLMPEALVAVGPAEIIRPLLEAAGYKIDEAVRFDAPVAKSERTAK